MTPFGFMSRVIINNTSIPKNINDKDYKDINSKKLQMMNSAILVCLKFNIMLMDFNLWFISLKGWKIEL